MKRQLDAVRLAIYARVSTDEQREGKNIDSQVAELQTFAASQRWLVERVYKDNGWSGGIMARPALDKLRDDAGNGKFQAVLINDVDRLARDVVHVGLIRRHLERHSVRIIFRKLPSEEGPVSNLLINILGSFAEFERQLIIDRTRRGRRYKVEGRKRYLGSNTAYGYRYVKMDRFSGRDGELRIHAGEAAVVRLIFQWVDEGLSTSAIVSRLNQHGIRPQKARLWGKSTVLRILHNEMYAGVWHYNKAESCEPQCRRLQRHYLKRIKTSTRQRPRTEWIPLSLSPRLRLVPRTQWEKVQRCLKMNQTFAPRNQKHEYLLKGLLRCAGCGATFVGDRSRGRFYYRCGRRCHRVPPAPEQELEKLVLQAIHHPSISIALPTVESSSQRKQRRVLQTMLRASVKEATFDGCRVVVQHCVPPADDLGAGV